MFTRHFNVSDVRNRLTDIVNRFGKSHRATSASGASCVYAVVEDGRLTPVCIVGQFVADLGLLGILLHDAPGDVEQPAQEGACSIGSNVWEDLEKVGVTFDEDAKAWLRAAQASQDGGDTWGTALASADAHYLFDTEKRARQALGLDTWHIDAPYTVREDDGTERVVPGRFS